MHSLGVNKVQRCKGTAKVTAFTFFLLHFRSSVILYFKVQFSINKPLTTIDSLINLNKLLIHCLLIVSKVVVKFRYWVGLGM